MKPNLFLLKALLACMVVTFSCIEAKSSSIFGSQITYKAIDSVKYVVTLTFYRDCNGISPSTPSIKVTDGAAVQFNQSLNFISKSDITFPYSVPGCSFTSRCTSSYAYGIEEWIYSDTITIAGGGCEYTFSYENCCRNGAITTGAANQNHYNYAIVNKCAGKNTVPRPMQAPRFIIPVGADVRLSPNMMEFDDKTDSVVFSLVSAKISATSNVTYTGNWGPQRPMSFLGFPSAGLNHPAGFHFDEVTGEVYFRPTKQNEIGVICIEAKEYRKVNGTDVLVGVTRLDMMVIITASSANVKMPNVYAQQTHNFCAGVEQCFTINTNSSDTTYIAALTNSLPGATVTTNSGQNESVTICWTPTMADVRRSPYLLTSATAPNICIPMYYATRTSIIYVNAPYDTSNHKVVSKTVSCNRVLVKAEKDTFPDLSLDWRVDDGFIDTIIGDSAVMYFPNPGWNYFAIRSKKTNGCFGLYELDSVFITPLYTLQLTKTSDTIICKFDSLQLSVAPKNGSSPYKFRWADAPKSNIATLNIQAVNHHYYAVTVTDNAGCLTKDSINIDVSAPGATVGPDTTVCKYTNLQLHAVPISGFPPFRFEWLGIDTLQTVNVQPNTSTLYQLKVADSSGCYNIIDKKVDVFAFSLDLGPNKIVCSGNPLTVTATAVDGKSPFTFPWPIIQTNKASYTYTPTADSVFTISITDDRGCTAYDTLVVKSSPPIVITLPASAQACNNTELTLTATISGGTSPYVYKWNGTNTSSNTFKFTVSGATTLMKLTVTDSGLCTNTQNVNITVLPNPTINAGNDDSVCNGAVVNLKASASMGTSPYNYAWSTGSNTDTTSFVAYSSNTYQVTVTDTNGCAGVDEVVISVYPRENAVFTTPSIICSHPFPFALTALPNNGTWQGPGISGGTFIPANAGIGKQSYVYTFTDSHACTTKDTTETEIYPAPVADFAISAPSGGVPLGVVFSNNSSGAHSFNWYIRNQNGTLIFTASQDNIGYTFTTPGTYKVTLWAANTNCIDSIEKTINVFSVGINDVVGQYVSVYPNPATDNVVIEGDGITKTSIIDMQGREMDVVLNKQTENKFEYNVSGLANGVYLIRVTMANGGEYRTKISINH